MSEDKVQENRVRRMAARQGFGVIKSRRRDPQALDYGGYMLVNLATNYIEYGGAPNAFNVNLDQIEKYLLQAPKRRRQKSGAPRKTGSAR